jgi:hypothetical protein
MKSTMFASKNYKKGKNIPKKTHLISETEQNSM